MSRSEPPALAARARCRLGLRFAAPFRVVLFRAAFRFAVFFRAGFLAVRLRAVFFPRAAVFFVPAVFLRTAFFLRAVLRVFFFLAAIAWFPLRRQRDHCSSFRWMRVALVCTGVRGRIESLISGEFETKCSQMV